MTEIENHIKIYDMQGKLIYMNNVNTIHTEIDLSKSPKGVYMISIKTIDGKNMNTKFILE